MKKNLFNNHLDSSSSSQSHGSQVGQITCEPCTLEVKKMNMKINGRKLSDIKEEEVAQIFSPFFNIEN
jgi:hypothetical protein